MGRIFTAIRRVDRGVIIAALEKIVEWLTRFSDWISQNQTLVENITLAVLAFLQHGSLKNLFQE